MNKAFQGILALSLLCLAAWAAWRLFPHDEKVIRSRLTKLAATASVDPKDSALFRHAKGEGLRDFFAQDVTVNSQRRHGAWDQIQGRAELMELLRMARANVQDAQFRLLDIAVQIDAEKASAQARMTLLADIDGEDNALAQELSMRMRKLEGNWVISAVETVQTFQPLR